ncbi:MAG: arsenate reductase ArsC [Ignavibacteria bacterium]|nr:arsenate reductase ArsC [Ignavibacteria bacterium]
MDKKKVLFVCVHNSARSQMAEAFLNNLGGDSFTAESAGLEPGKLNPYVIRVLQEEGIDISGKQTNDVFNFYREGRLYDYVITVCDETAGERCPLFPGISERIHWSFEDPSSLKGTDEEILSRVRIIRDEIKSKITEFINFKK